MVTAPPALSASGVWWSAVRPATLAASIAPVLAGTAIAVHQGGPRWWAGLGALVVSIAIQVGVNLANDYSDHVRGADAQRVGPLRAASSGVIDPAHVRLAVNRNHLTEDISVRSEPASPQAITQDDHGWAAGSALFWQEITAQRQLHAQQGEQLGRSASGRNPFRLASTGQGRIVPPREEGQAVE